MTDKIEKKDIEKLLACSCHSLTHVIGISLFFWPQDKYPELSIEMAISHFNPWYKRIYLAFKYVFKKENCCGYDSFMFDYETAKEAKKVFDTYLKHMNGFINE